MREAFIDTLLSAIAAGNCRRGTNSGTTAASTGMRIASWVSGAANPALENLNLAVGGFASGIPRAGVAAAVLNGLPDAQRVGQYLVNVAEHALEMVVEHPETELPVPELVSAQDSLCARAVELLGVTQVEAPGWSADKLGEQRRNFETDYQALKARMLLAGTAGEVPPKRMAATLERMSELHRIVDQATKAAIYLDRFIKMSRPPGVPVVQIEQTAQTVPVPAVAPAPQDQSDTSPQSP